MPEDLSATLGCHLQPHWCLQPRRSNEHFAATLCCPQARALSWLILRRGHTTCGQYFQNNMKINIFVGGGLQPRITAGVWGVPGHGHLPLPGGSALQHARPASLPQPGPPASVVACPAGRGLPCATAPRSCRGEARAPPAEPPPPPPCRERGCWGAEKDVPSKCSEVAAVGGHVLMI